MKIPVNTKTYKHPFQADLLTGKRALVTGASRGIGRQCSLGLVACGAEVIAVARSESDLASLQKEAGSLLTPFPADASRTGFLSEIENFKPLDVLVNNLGTNIPQPFLEVSPETLEKIWNLNVSTLFKITQKVVGIMLQQGNGGSIINLSSQMGHVGAPDRTVYCASKHAVEGLTKALAIEFAAESIRVNSVAPTFIETPMTEPMFSDAAFKRFITANIPLGKIGNPHDVANAVVFLASDAAALITGASLKVDGGWTAR